MSVERFIERQKHQFDLAFEEISNGRKESHWIWYIFPQLKGLGYSDMCQIYGIDGKKECEEYINNEYLFSNLLKITKALLNIKGKSIGEIVGFPDDLKIKSSMTLFYFVSKNNIFKEVIDKYYSGKFDEVTIKMLDK